jgi:hypothetical protein
LILALILLLPGLRLPAQAAGGEAALPLSRVVLFSSGVGYFQRDGQVEGNASVELSFRAADVNDLLKSLVLRDFDGGQVSGVTYASRDPLTRTLRSFAIDLTGNPDLAGILSQARGEALEVVSSETIRGTLVGLETKKTKEEVTEVYLNLLTDRGLRSIALSQTQEVRFLNAQLDKELRSALALLAQSHSQDRKRVVLAFSGKGRRRVQVGYLLETPVWKTSYRMVLGAEQSHFLQGWAIVENTTDQDWRFVKLSLVSGRPVSFIMDLYQPLYLQRPLVQPELYANLRPQKYEEDLTAPPAPAPMAKAAEAAPSRSRAPMAESLREVGGPEEELAAEPMDLRQGVSAAAQAGEAGSFFQYSISFPVSLQRQESAMLPIVGQEVEGRRFSIYNERVHPKHPMHGLKLKNNTGLTLMGGPITLFEAGTYAGDAQIDTLPAGAERLISFALDLETEVSPVARSQPDQLVAVRISRGTLVSTVTLRREKTYTVKVSGAKPREVLVEHLLSPDWELVAPKQPEERTRDLYRFLVKATPTVSAPAVQTLLVAEERKVDQSVAVTNLSDQQIAIYMKAPVVSARVKEALNGLAKRKAELADTLRQRQEQERKAQSIRGEQGRIRQNMDSLSRDSALYKRYVAQLDSQENELAAILPEIDRLAKKELDQRKALDDYILSMDVK